ncbi:MAG TPA: XdhC family protein, partial [Holophaga sp.]|nr:XdhC family protein [Holophaga sp.]
MEHTIFKTIVESREPLVLATIIAVKGSSPRHPGTGMLLGAASGRTGTVGGGKGELAVLQACRLSLETHRASLLEVEMLGDDVAGAEMICGGVTTLLVEYLDDVAPYRIALERIARGEQALLMKRVGPAAGGSVAVDVSLLDGNGKPLY